ncbi:uncharacterized protein LOC135391525 isoform X1 [Ornithodoros turicata]|uniref:uncharacterized protein LOC135391525 isoform X1 n=1 Tax=Ornithodoros turicata TaxID=34597 RepID=UPI00313A07D3
MAISTELECITLANKLIVDCQLAHPRVSRMSGFSSQLFCQLFEAICGSSVSDLKRNPQSEVDEILMMQELIDTLSQDVLQLSLSHISGRDVISRDPRSVLDILQVLGACLALQSSPEISTLSEPSRHSTTCSVSEASFDKGSSSSASCGSPCVVCTYMNNRSREMHMQHPGESGMAAPSSKSEERKASAVPERKQMPNEKSGKPFVEMHDTSHPYWLRSSPELHMPSISTVDQHIPQCLGDQTRKKKRLKMAQKSVLWPCDTRRMRTRSKHQRYQPDKKTSGHTSLEEEGEILTPHSERVLQKLNEQQAIFAARCCVRQTSIAQLNKQYVQQLNSHLEHVQRLQKEVKHSQRMNFLESQRNVHHAVQSLQVERRQMAARIKRSMEKHDEVVRARHARQQHAHQQMLFEAFQESLRTRKADLQEALKMARDKKVREEDRHRAQIASLKNFYDMQLSLLSEALAKEKMEFQQRAQAQSKVLDKMRREFRNRLDEETRRLQVEFAETGVTQLRPSDTRKRIRFT